MEGEDLKGDENSTDYRRRLDQTLIGEETTFEDLSFDQQYLRRVARHFEDYVIKGYGKTRAGKELEILLTEKNEFGVTFDRLNSRCMALQWIVDGKTHAQIINSGLLD